jgi:hypothetical protein
MRLSRTRYAEPARRSHFYSISGTGSIPPTVPSAAASTTSNVPAAPAAPTTSTVPTMFAALAAPTVPAILAVAVAVAVDSKLGTGFGTG